MSDLFSKNYDPIPYDQWKSLLQQKQNISRQMHYAPYEEKKVLGKTMGALEEKVMSVPDEYWTRLIKEGKR